MTAEKSRSRAAVPIPDQFATWLDIRARNRDTDQFGHVNHAAMATLFEEGRIALIFAPDHAAETAGTDLLIASLTMNFHKELRAPAPIRIGSIVTRIGTSSLEIRQGLFAGDTCYASAEAACVLFGCSSRRPVTVSDALRSSLLNAG